MAWALFNMESISIKRGDLESKQHTGVGTWEDSYLPPKTLYPSCPLEDQLEKNLILNLI